MNIIRTRRLALLPALPILLAGCATASADSPTAAQPKPSSSTSTATGMSMPPGTSMPPGMSMPGMSMPGMTEQAAAPSESAEMICGAEIRGSVATILGLAKPPAATTTWADNLYTCTYHLANGPLTVSVKESGDVAAAKNYFDALRQRLGTTQPLRGLDSLGLPAFETSNGTVAFVKDDKTLQVDATQLPSEVNEQHRQRADLAYTLATDILGCWNE
jgi:hypothetical protein